MKRAYTGLTRGARADVHIQIHAERPRSGASLYALTLQALRVGEFRAIQNSKIMEVMPRERMEGGKQCSLDECRRLLDCDCLGLYEHPDNFEES